MSDHRPGDVSLVIDGSPRTLRLTLGALAALEEELAEGDFSALARRLEHPRVADLLLILKALLAGGGFPTTLDALKASDLDLGEASRAIARAFRALSPRDDARGESAAGATAFPSLGKGGDRGGIGEVEATPVPSLANPHPSPPLSKGREFQRAAPSPSPSSNETAP